MRYRKPEELKETNIEWIEVVPNHWAKVKIKFLSNVNPKKSQVKLDSDAETTYLPMESLEEFGGMDVSQTKSLREVYDGYTYFREGDVLSAKITPCFENGKAAIAMNLVNKVGFGTTEIHVLRPRENVLKEILFYNLISHHYLKLGKASMYGAGGQKRVSTYFLEEFQILLPPKTEQRSIASFLDRKTKAIDHLIQKKEQLIERLKEKRQALITRAVTKGFNPSVPMKDSGIEWLGEIPEEWEITKLKWLVSKIGSGKTPRGGSEVYEEEGIPFLRSQNIHFDGLRLDDVVYIDSETHKDMSSTAIKPNDVLLNITGASIGRSSLTPKNFPKANLNQHVCILRPRKESVSPDFLHLVISSDLIQNQIFAFENGTSREGLNFSQVGSLLVSLPQLEEQKNIVRKAREYEDQIFSLAKNIDEQVQKLKEYRQSLISAAVTGKIDVRDEAKVTKEENAQTANIYFKRRVLAAKILDDLHQEPTLGRRKLQKILYLLEKEIKAVELKGKYQKDAAGPFDNKMMRSIESQLEKAEWFKQVERENGYGYKYLPMIKKDEYKKYYSRYWGNINDEIEELIQLLRPEKTDLLSLVATLYACWNDFLIKDEEFDGKRLIYESRYNWHEEKREIPYKDWAEALNWMWDNGLKPEGVGELTREKR